MSDKVILLNSNDLVDGEAKKVNPSDVSYGEIAINYSSGNEVIMTKNDTDSIAEFVKGSYYDSYISEVKPSVFLQEDEPDGKDGDLWIRDTSSLIKDVSYITYSENQEVKLLNDDTYIDYCYDVEGSSEIQTVGGELYHVFANSGVHRIRIRFKDGLKSVSKAFYGCSDLYSIPSDLFDSLIDVEDFSGCFSGCRKLSEVPEDLFMYNSKMKNASNIFYGCQFITVPSLLFYYNNLVEDFSSAFESCSHLMEVPSSFFSSFSSCVNMSCVFKNCISLKTVPYNLFLHCDSLYDLSSAFYGCKISEIPERFTDYSSNLEDVSYMFYECSSIASLPSDLFRRNSKISNFSNTFNGCISLSGDIPTDQNGNKIYERSSVLLHDKCFYGCSGLTGFDAIPDDWK